MADGWCAFQGGGLRVLRSPPGFMVVRFGRCPGCVSRLAGDDRGGALTLVDDRVEHSGMSALQQNVRPSRDRPGKRRRVSLWTAAAVAIWAAALPVLIVRARPGVVVLLVVAAAMLGGLIFGRARLAWRLFAYERVAFPGARVSALVVRADLRVVRANAAACSLFGRSSAELRGSSILEFADPDEPPWRLAMSQAPPVDRTDSPAVRRLIRGDGSLAEVAITATDISPAAAEPLWVVHLHEVTAQRRAEREQAAIAALGRHAIESRNPVALISESVLLVCEQLRAAGCIATRRLADGEVRVVATTGDLRDARSARDAPTQSAYTLTVREPVISDDLANDTRFAVPAVVLAQGYRRGLSVPIPENAGARHAIIAYLRADQRSFTQHDAEFVQTVAELVGAALDRAAAEDDLRRRALEDPLTGLANRRLLINRLDASVRNSEQVGHRVHVIALELDRFELINDTFGREVGDAILRGIAARLIGCARSEDLIARAAGDEFVVVATRIAGDDSGMKPRANSPTRSRSRMRCTATRS